MAMRLLRINLTFPRVAAVALAVVLAAATSSPTYAKKSDLTPAAANREAKKARKSYENCRQDALAQLKRGSLSKRKLETALSTCKENFPGASLYIGCKKSAIKTARSRAVSEEEAVAQCRRYLTATSFDPAAPVPFFAEAGQLFFAGIGLNKSQPAASLSPPNFGCSRLKAATAAPAKGQYLLFGNHPKLFADLGERSPAALAALLPHPPASKKSGKRRSKGGKDNKGGYDIAGFGRIFGDPKAASGTVYFASAPCDFEAETGDLLAALSAYYLLDQGSASVTPYFGIAYFQEDQRAVTTSQLVQSLIRTLGSSFKATAKNRLVTFIAEDAAGAGGAGGITETDDEQDPKNLCRPPRSHRLLGVVQARKDAPTRPDYLIVANVKNLCDFGDRLAKRLTE